MSPYKQIYVLDAWVPARASKGEYLQIELNEVTSVYGLEMEGSVDEDSYVSSLALMYSDDGHIYHQYSSKENNPKVCNSLHWKIKKNLIIFISISINFNPKS